jgi:hypothetical protein
MTGDEANDQWPSLPLDAWRDTQATLHLWMQIVGKVRLARCPWINHSWTATLYVTPKGLTTASIPHGTRTFQIDLDFIHHLLVIQASDGRTGHFKLEPQSVARFYSRLMEQMHKIDLDVDIHKRPNEIADAVPFDSDESHAAYDREYVNRFSRILVQVDRVFTAFRSRFIGKSSPVHFFWGSADLAVTRFSGRRAPQHPGGIPGLPDRITREAYSHEVASCGFWAGGGAIPYPAFYAYAYPEPQGYANASVKPETAFYSGDLREFILAYDAVRQSADPDATLTDFLQSTYEAAANLAQWDRASLERSAGSPRRD